MPPADMKARSPYKYEYVRIHWGNIPRCLSPGLYCRLPSVVRYAMVFWNGAAEQAIVAYV